MPSTFFDEIREISQEYLKRLPLTFQTFDDMVRDWQVMLEQHYGEEDSNGSGSVSDALDMMSRILVENNFLEKQFSYLQ